MMIRSLIVEMYLSNILLTIYSNGVDRDHDVAIKILISEKDLNVACFCELNLKLNCEYDLWSQRMSCRDY